MLAATHDVSEVHHAEESREGDLYTDPTIIEEMLSVLRDTPQDFSRVRAGPLPLSGCHRRHLGSPRRRTATLREAELPTFSPMFATGGQFHRIHQVPLLRILRREHDATNLPKLVAGCGSVEAQDHGPFAEISKQAVGIVCFQTTKKGEFADRLAIPQPLEEFVGQGFGSKRVIQYRNRDSSCRCRRFPLARCPWFGFGAVFCFRHARD